MFRITHVVEYLVKRRHSIHRGVYFASGSALGIASLDNGENKAGYMRKYRTIAMETEIREYHRLER